MRRHTLLLPVLILIVMGPSAGVVFAQDPDTPRFEVGAQAAVLRLDDAGTTGTGVGGRVTWNLSRWMAVEGEANFYPQDNLIAPASSFTPDLRVEYKRRRGDVFFGTKVGVRGERFGLFAKARPGLARQSNGGVQCVGDVCALVLLMVPEYRTEFALDLGGVFEVYPSARTVLRFEVGDTIIWHRSVAPPCFGASCTSNNLSSKFGAGLRF
jgi:hypothetical protein